MLCLNYLLGKIWEYRKSLSEALILASTNPQYDDRLYIELHVQYLHENSKLKPGENILCTEIVSYN